MKRYNPADIEPKWQQQWDETGLYTADLNSEKPKYIAMSMFNYPSGAGIHIGHAMNYTISDVKARFKRQQGFESYHPVGWDAFGLPAENYAIKAGVSPQASMAKIIPSYHKQYKAMGWSNDWTKEISTHLPEYYKWSQWIFSEMYRAGLAYQDARMQWWCTKCQTVLANEQVLDGKCWRHDAPDDLLVEKKEVKQWFFKITDYADELLEAIDDLDWSESVKLAQKNWIGKSIGAEIKFKVKSSDMAITVFTTRPDTLFGVTFLVVAPDNEIVSSIISADQKTEVEAYISESTKKTEVERQASKQKTGVFSGSYAINPINNEQIPIWIADYVLANYGTGAIMAVPAHDERDNEFAKAYNIPIISVVAQDFGEKLNDTKDVEGSVVMGYDKNTKQYFALLNKNVNQAWLVSGGREDHETFEQTAIRELAEEGGFKKFEKLIQLGDPVYSYYYNDNKKSNRRSLGYNYLAFVDKNDIESGSFESHENFEAMWLDYDALTKALSKTGGGVEHWLEALRRAHEVVLADEKSEPYIFEPYHGEGVMINSEKFNGMHSADAREKIVADLSAADSATEKTNYKMRDWSVSRQRYWGAPIPIIDCPKCGVVLVPDKDLPVVLPELTDFAPNGDGRSALARATKWLTVNCPECDGPAERETDTLDTYIDSSWYMYRYFDPKNQEKIFNNDIVKKWEPIDFYNGADHATAHLLYARFIARFFTKQGLINEPEPFKHFLFNGKITGADGQMFSKTLGNGVDPLEIINSGYGADALRIYLMFAAPLDVWVKWDSQGVPGAYRFITRLWNLVQEYTEATESTESNAVETKELRAVSHKMIKKITDDIEHDRYNTAIAAVMGTLNDLSKLRTKNIAKNKVWQEALEAMVACIAPFAPHAADEMWQILGHSNSVNKDSWPAWNEEYLQTDTATIAVQVNGKLRGEVVVEKDADQSAVETKALQLETVQQQLGTKKPARIIYVPGRLMNIVF